MLGMRTDASGVARAPPPARARAVRYVPMSNAESRAVDAPAEDAAHEPDLAKIERDLAEIELMLERLN